MKLKFTSLLILAVGASAARASLTLTVGNYYLLPDTAGQVIPIYILGGDAIQGDMLYVQVADGGPQANGYILGPTITNLDVITNSIFAGIDSGQTPSDTGYVVDQLAIAGTTIRRDAGVTSVPGSGLVAMITVSTLGFTTIGESWEFCLKDTVDGGSTQFGDVPVTIINGTLTIAGAPATSTWNGTANSYWYNASQWSAGVPGFGSGDQAAFTGNVIPRTIDLGAANQRLASLLLDSGTNSASWSVISTGGGKLLMDNGANSATIQVGGTGSGHTIGTKIDLLSSTTIDFIASNSLTLSGIINGPSSSTLTLQGVGGTLILTADNTLSGPVNILSGVLQVGTGGTTGSLGSGTIANSGTLAFNRSDAVTISNVITGSGALNLNSGSVTLTGAAAYTGATSVAANSLLNFSGGVAHSVKAISGNGVVKVDAGGTLTSRTVNMPSGTLSVDGVHVIASNSGVSVVSVLALGGSGPSSWTGQLDLKNNDLIVHNGADVVSQIKQASLGSWNATQSGITSSTAALGGITKMALAFATGTEYAGVLTPARTTFDGQPIVATDELVMFTLAGDSNMDSKVTFADFQKLQNNYGGTGKVWTQGDYNYDGKVTFADFQILQNNYGKTYTPPAPQSDGAGLGDLGSLGGGTGLTQPLLSVGVGASAVPEPASLAVLALGGVGLLTRRKRNHGRST